MISRSVLLGSSMLIALASASTAFAQAEPAPAGEAAEVEAVVVTGSRIRRPDLTSTAPIQVLAAETIDNRGYTNLADALNDIPSAGIPINPVGDQGSFGTGRQYINLFNLGTNRTLTLVNGRRFVGSNVASLFTGAGAGGQVDFNAIPTGLVDRVETIQAGGAAVYGSDAIAGVINVITKTNFQGVEVDGQVGVSSRNDGENYRARITAGHNFLDGRLNVSGSYEYAQTTTLGYADRAATRRQLSFAANPANRTATDGIPGSIIILDRRIPETTLGGLAFRGTGGALSDLLTMPDPANPGRRIAAQFAPGGELIPYNTGTFYSQGVAAGGDGLNLANLTSLISPVKRHVATLFSRFDVTDNVRFNTEVFYNHQTSVEPYNQPIYNAPIFGGNSASLRMSTANPFLSTQARNILLSQGTPLAADAASPGDGIFYLSRSSTDIGNNRTSTEGDLLRTVFNLEGDFEFAERNFFWNVAGNFGKSWGSFTSPNVNQARFTEAVDAVTLGGNIVCRSAAARAAGCAPLNLFGQGAPSQAALDYVLVDFASDYAVIQTGYEANFGGDIVRLPAGMVSFNAGYEYRKEKSRFSPNDPQRLGVGRSAAISAISGSYDTKEVYIEGVIPVFGGEFSFPGMRSLELEGARRRVKNSQAGTNDAWSYGVRWKPIEDLMIRGTKSASFRAPAITELFLPDAASFMSVTVDPCDARNINVGPNPAARQANCRAEFQALGLPANFNLTSNIQAATVQGTTSGNPNLRNEIADSWSVGFVYQPRFVRGLAVSFDWVEIDIKDAIVNFNLNSIMQVCYDSPVQPADVCSRFSRNSAGQVRGAEQAIGYTGPSAGFVNAGYTTFKGATFGVDYKFALTDIGYLADRVNGANLGTLDFGFDLYHTNKQETSVTGLGFDLNRDKGEIGYPDVAWTLNSTYARGPLAVTLTTDFISKSEFNRDFTPETRDPLWVKDYYVNHLSLSYDLTDHVGGAYGFDGVKARVNVRNLFDKEPPYGTTLPGVYDLVGRYFQFGLNARF